ncbi:alkaline phosphatase family protein [Amycolatopsis cihanbeyliensis]|uniref:Type I phosphodiesterase/nucleotide pyrophosphatase n=1 Tax=Amycolatopsis cihanbeyliensis TaxID=1128664 RepID=A0A542DRF3_AMYCI|nr:alkaline phosphatase family protein [Amycolatopsis cihanbeyliensis]TQJ05692.1 type I phosphodiesterase/nucleotide pyrophosphatase [Amycolatopsis cihanbeyliensis]
MLDERIPHLATVVPAALAALGVDGCTGGLGFPELTGACVLLVDGLGWELLEEHADAAPVLAGLRRGPLRVGYPATTVAGLSAIGTGVPSGEHGMVGYSFEVPGVGVLNALRWCGHPGGEDLRAAATPEEVQPLPTTFAMAAAAGLAVSVVSAAEYKHSALTRAVLRGGRYVGVHALGDLAARALAAIGEPGTFCYAYHSELDMLGHVYGPGSAAWRMQLRQVDRLVESLVDGLRPGTMLAVVADHGMVGLDGTAVDADDTPELLAGVRALGGEVRARHVYTEDGAAGDVLAAWRETLGARAWVLPGEEAIARGWFGPRVADHVRPRIGDVVAAARGRSGVLRELAEPVESAMRGQHGSLTSAEQLVPLAVAHG